MIPFHAPHVRMVTLQHLKVKGCFYCAWKGAEVAKKKEPKVYRKSFIYKGVRYFGKRADSEAQAIRNADDLRKQIEANDLVRTTNRTVRSWALECVETYKVKQSDVTRQKYLEKLECYVLKYIGDMRLVDITPMQCQQLVNKQADKSQATINDVYQQLQFIFRMARINRMIPYDPAEHIVKPTGYYHPRRALTTYEEKIFLKVLPLHHCPLFYALMYYAGCRPSEAASVEGRDIQERAGKWYLHIRGTKTKSADRYVPIMPELMAFVPKKRSPFELLCKSQAGTKLNKESMRRGWSYLERLMNIAMGARLYRNQLIPPLPLATDLSAYCLRHTFCTNLQKKGVDIRTAQYLMGHADIKMTANIYTHVDFEIISDAADKMSRKANDEEQGAPAQLDTYA